MAEPIAEDTSPEPVATEPPDTEAALPEPSGQEPVTNLESGFGVTPLSAIERLSAAGDLSPHIRRHDRILTAAWAASFAALAALGVAGYTKRDTLMREWPASKRVYATLGLAPVDAKSRDGKDTTEHPEH